MSSATTYLVEVKINVPGHETTVSICRDVSKLPPDEECDAEPYSTKYTGRHDGGELPKPRKHQYGHLLDAIKEAKLQADAFVKDKGYPSSAPSAAVDADDSTKVLPGKTSDEASTAVGSKDDSSSVGASPAGKKPRID